MIVESILIVVVFGGLIAVGVPVFASMGIAGGLGIVLLRGPGSITDVPYFLYEGLNSYLLVAVPLFVLTGTLMHEIGASRALFNFARDIVGRLPHALGLAVLLSCAVFAAISGSSVATAATIGLVALPALTQQGYRGGDAGSIVAAGGTLGILIPPSIAMIIFGVLTEQSIGQLFIAGVLPGLMLIVFFAVALFIAVRPTIRGERVELRAKLLSLRKSALVLALPLLIMIVIYTGVATATEAAAMAVVLVVLMGVVFYRNLTYKRFKAAVVGALKSSAMIMILIAFGDVLTRSLTLARVPTQVSSAIAEAGLPSLLTFTLMIVIYIVLGMFLESTSMIIVTIPIFFPLSQLIGIDPIAFGVIVVIAMEMGQITPPVGINLFVVSGVGRVPLGQLARRIWPYFGALLAVAYLVYFIPQIATWLPSLMVAR